MSPSTCSPGAAYAPAVPSPLNPRSQEEEALGLRRRRLGRAMTRRSTATNPAQKLLRLKAADAWRSQVLRREVARYERRALEAIAARQTKPSAAGPDQAAREDLSAVDRVAAGSPSDERTAPAEDKGQRQTRPPPQHHQLQQQQHEYLFHMPDLGFFTPRRVVLAVGMKRMLPFLQSREALRCPETAS
ncbi:hypothetical protein CDD83_7430 [Cordyceps sp. RAO-2017]|nr:hypothetical protein CDD83_7430 [Cordyceps sp. RAO-2017]